MTSEFGTFHHDGCLFLGLCTKFDSNVSYSYRELMTSRELTSGLFLVTWASPRGRVASLNHIFAQTSSSSTETLAL